MPTLKEKESEKLQVFGATDADASVVFDYCKNARIILVTEDSNSMITEAVCCKKPVIAIAPKLRKMNNDEDGYLAYLRSRGWLASADLNTSLELRSIIEKANRLEPMHGNHLDQLAKKLQLVVDLVANNQA